MPLHPFGSTIRFSPYHAAGVGIIAALAPPAPAYVLPYPQDVHHGAR